MNFAKYKKCVASLGITFLLIVVCFSNQTFATVKTAQNENDVSITFKIKLKIDGDTPNEDDIFTFVLEAKDGAPLPETSYETIKGEGITEFGKINFTQRGKYEYTIFERNDGVGNYTYDSRIYQIYVNVQYDNNGKLFATYTVYNGDVKESEIVFINEYNAVYPTSEETTPSETTVRSYETSFSTLDEWESIVTDSPVETTKLLKSVTSSSISPTPTSCKSDVVGTPTTGDSTNNIPWIVLLFVTFTGSIGCMLYLNIIKNRDKDENKT
jgi:pilin isopeptide linkage protein